MIWAAVAASAAAGIVCWVIARSRIGSWFLDNPNHRSLHDQPTPRGGGIGIWAGLGAGVAFMTAAALPGAREAVILFVSVTPLVVLGLVDDRRGLPAAIRFPVQAAAAISMIWFAGWTLDSLAIGGFVIRLGIWAAPITVLGIVWASNLYNFMDGLDGLAGSMAVIGFGALSIWAWRAGAPDVAAVALLPAAAALAFLTTNWPPARLFLGDSGSVPLGFLAAAIGLFGVHRGAWTVLVPIIAFAPFAFDATMTLFARLARGERVWQPHRSHAYQRMVLAGWSRRQTLGIELGFMLVSAVAAGVARTDDRRAAAIALAAVLLGYAGLLVAARRGTGPPRSGV